MIHLLPSMIGMFVNADSVVAVTLLKLNLKLHLMTLILYFNEKNKS